MRHTWEEREQEKSAKAEGKIRILIVDDIPETRENLRKLLYFEPDMEVIGTAESGEEAVAMAKELKPDIVLMDINMPGLDGIAATEAITREAPMSQVIMMSVQGETDYLRRSMLAGAREFLIKPFSSDDLISSIRRVYKLGLTRRPPQVAQPPGPVPPAMPAPPPPPEGKILTVFSPKGGTGCSVVAVNLAIALQEISKEKVALVDGNLQFGDVGVLLNLQATHTIADLIPKINDLDIDLLMGAMTPHSSGLKVLLAPPRPEMADLVTSEHLCTILRELKKAFNYVVVDTWSSLHDVTLALLDIADHIILITTPEIPAIKNAKLFFDLGEVLGYSPDKTVLIVNKVNRRGGIRPEDIASSIKHPVAAVIPVDEGVRLAINKGVPLLISHRNAPLSQGILALARHLLQEMEAKEGEKTSKAAKHPLSLLRRAIH